MHGDIYSNISSKQRKDIHPDAEKYVVFSLMAEFFTHGEKEWVQPRKGRYDTGIPPTGGRSVLTATI